MTICRLILLFALGDCYALGGGASAPEKGYAALLGADIRAVSGATTEEVKEQLNGLSSGRAVLIPGANDMWAGTSADVYRGDLQALANAAAAQGISLYVGTPLPWKEGSPLWQEYVSATLTITGVVLVDLRGYDPLTMESSPHPRHPNDAGHAWLAARFGAALAGHKVYVPVSANTRRPVNRMWLAMRFHLSGFR